MIRPADSQSLEEAAERLRRGELVAIPTETVYGLAADAWNSTAVGKIFEVKGRPPTNPLIVHVASVERFEWAAAWPPSDELAELLDRLAPCWPGPLTVVVPRNARIPDVVTAGLDTVGLRVPAHPVALELLRRCEFPLAAPSANPSNYVSPTTARHVADELGDRVAMILDGGPCRAGVESTILSLVERPPRLLRAGALAVEELAERLEVSVETLVRPAPARPAGPAAQLAPGQLPEHYAPRTPLFFADEPVVATLADRRVGRIRFERRGANEPAATEERLLSEQGDLSEAARRLFAALRELDRLNLDAIVVDRCVETGLGRAVMDRLRRARRSR